MDLDTIGDLGKRRCKEEEKILRGVGPSESQWSGEGEEVELHSFDEGPYEKGELSLSLSLSMLHATPPPTNAGGCGMKHRE